MAIMLHRRAVQRTVGERLNEAPVVRLSGPRASGKSTTCVAEIERYGGTVVRLDDPDEGRAVAADPSGYLGGLSHPILIDEYQRVPSTLDVVKADLSRSGAEPGRWLLTGSVAISAVQETADSLGGRLTDVHMGTLTVDERNDWAEPHFVGHLLAEDLRRLQAWRPEQRMERDELLAEAQRGGFPLVTDRESAQSRRRGLTDWVEASVIVDGAEVGGVRNVESLRRMLRLYASSTGTITPKDRPTAERLEVDRRTVAAYRDLVGALHVTWDLPALVPGNAAGQVTRSPKLHLVDSGLAAALAGRDRPASLARDPQAAGALVETMVVNDLRVHASVHEDEPRLYHFREDSSEVDLVIETADGGILGVEIKLTASPSDRDLNGLRRLRKSSGSLWRGGVVLCRVLAAYLPEDDIAVVPIEAVWQLT